jgi:hypothetical protein
MTSLLKSASILQRSTQRSPAGSPEAVKAMGQQVRSRRLHQRTGLGLDALAEAINPIAAG